MFLKLKNLSFEKKFLGFCFTRFTSQKILSFQLVLSFLRPGVSLFTNATSFLVSSSFHLNISWFSGAANLAVIEKVGLLLLFSSVFGISWVVYAFRLACWFQSL